jgi:hypothetical protein
MAGRQIGEGYIFRFKKVLIFIFKNYSKVVRCSPPSAICTGSQGGEVYCQNLKLVVKKELPAYTRAGATFSCYFSLLVYLFQKQFVRGQMIR